MYDDKASQKYVDELGDRHAFTDYQRRALHLAMMIAEDNEIPASYNGNLDKYCDYNHVWGGNIGTIPTKETES